MKLQPRGDRLIVAPAEEDAVRESGLVLPEQAKESPQRGRVLAAGPESSLEPEEIVLYSKYGGTEIDYEGEEYLVLRDADVLAVEVPA